MTSASHLPQHEGIIEEVLHFLIQVHVVTAQRCNWYA